MKEDLGTKLSAYLREYDRPQSYVAQKLNKSPGTITKWINGTNQMSVEAIRDFCDLFDLSNEAYVELLKLAGHPVITVGTSNYRTTTEIERESRFKLAEKTTQPNPLIFETSQRSVTIGRAPHNTVQLTDLVVSWEHGRIDLEQGVYLYRHLSNSNPSILRRKGKEHLFRPGKKEELELRNQDRLTIGSKTFIVECDLIAEDTGYTTTAKKPEGT